MFWMRVNNRYALIVLGIYRGASVWMTVGSYTCDHVVTALVIKEKEPTKQGLFIRTQAKNIACIGWNLGMNQNDVKHHR